MTTITWILISLAALAIVVIVWGGLYQRATRETSLVRTGIGGRKVVMDGGAIAVPYFHEVQRVNMQTLRLEVRRGAEWVRQDYLPGGGPFVTEARAIPIDLEGITGERVEIRMHPPIGFWSLEAFYLAWDEHLHTVVAVKLLRPDRVRDERALRGFRREAEALRRLAEEVEALVAGRAVGAEVHGDVEALGPERDRDRVGVEPRDHIIWVGPSQGDDELAPAAADVDHIVGALEQGQIVNETLADVLSRSAETIFKGEVLEEINETTDVHSKQAYIVIEESDLSNLIKKSRNNNLQIGKDVGIISYNDSPLKEILLDGITVVTTDHNKMGETAARLILENSKEKIKNPFVLIRRGSL